MNTNLNIKLNRSTGMRLLGGGSLVGLAMLGILCLYPSCPDPASAITNTTTYSETRVAVRATASIAVSLKPQVEIEVTPAANGSFGLSSTTLGIATNNTEGYKVFLYTSDGSGKLTNTDISKTDSAGSVYAISSIEDTTSGKNFPSNTWGYALMPTTTTITEESSFSPVPTSNTNHVLNKESVDVNGKDTTEDKYNLAFGTAISTSLPAGTYSNSVVVSVVANPQTITSLEQLVYMQDMNSSICNNTVSAYNHETKTTDRNSTYYLNPITKQLIDVRDGKKYWVAKLADGNCWMTQNLALDLDTNANGNAVATTVNGGQTELNSSNTDINGVWSGNIPKTEMGVPEKVAEADAGTTRSWDLGEIVLSVPSGTETCRQALPDDLAAEGYVANKNSSAYYGYKITETCSQYYTDVAGYTSTGVGWAENESVDTLAKTYDARYLLGNYYQWGTATAGTGIGITAPLDGFSSPTELVDATSSICPKGWQLPRAGAYSDTQNDDTATVTWPYQREWSFMNLFVSYGYPTANTIDNTTVQPPDWTKTRGTAIVGAGRSQIEWPPMYFVRTGTLNVIQGALQYMGNGGVYWSSTVYPGSSTMAHAFNYGSVNLYPTGQYDQYIGAVVRCLAR